MAVIEDKQTISSNVSGFKKVIDASAATMMLDNLQTFMYQRPIQSCVRESVSNGIDAIKEKRMAIDILSGKAKVEDYYVEKEIEEGQASLYQDSKFNKEYYDTKWLNPSDTVVIEYQNTGGTKRDILTITDTGVGLGGRRLEGYFALGYSSKRLNTKELGGFGLGAKSPLATGVESYRVISRYNGMEFCFDVYSHKVDCVYGRWNEDESENDFYEFQPQIVGHEEAVDENGEVFEKPIYSRFKAYYKKTKEKNGTSIVIEVKKYNKHQYFEAVRSQLMYVREDVRFYETYSDNPRQDEVRFKANIVYEDDHIILSDNCHYYQPHFVIKNICYGLVNYNEMEMTPRQGNIGIKLQMENVDVVPSREALAYTPKTRAATIEEHEWVNKIVEKKIQESLNQDSFLQWTRACTKVLVESGSQARDVVSRLAMLSDKSKLQPVFKNTGLKYKDQMFTFATPLIELQHIKQVYEYDKSKRMNVYRTKRETTNQMVAFNYQPYFQFDTASNRTTQYLLSVNKHNGWIAIRSGKAYAYLDAPLQKLMLGGDVKEVKKEMEDLIKENTEDATKAVVAQSYIDKTINWLRTMQAAKDVPIYSEKLVPESYVMKSEDEEVNEEKDEAQRRADYKEVLARRKANKAFVANIPGRRYVTSKSRNIVTGFTRKEVKYKDLDIDTCKVVYGTDDDSATFCWLTELKSRKDSGRSYETKDYFWDKDIKMMKVSKENTKYLKDDGVRVDDYLFNVDKEGKLTFPDYVTEAITGLVVRTSLGSKATFLSNFQDFSPMLTASYKKLSAMNGCSIAEHGQNESLLLIEKAYRAQLAISEKKGATEEEKAELIPKELKEKGVKSISVIDEAVLGELDNVSEFVNHYGSLLCHIQPLTSNSRIKLQADTVEEIKNYLRSKYDQLKGKYPDLQV